MTAVFEIRRETLFLRFTVSRQTYRYNTKIPMTAQQWKDEQRTGYRNTKQALEMEDKVNGILSTIDPGSFSMAQFNAAMERPLEIADALTRWKSRYDEYRSSRDLAPRTLGLDKATFYHVDQFLEKNPSLNNIHIWTPVVLSDFHKFMIKTVAMASAEIYLETLRTFFNWLVNEEEVLARSPFKKYDIPQSTNNWFPYDEDEIAKILGVVPKTEAQEMAFLWSKMVLFSGGTDMKDFAEMRFRQVQNEALQMVRTKSKNKSNDAKKLLYKTKSIVELFEALANEKGDPDDFVFPIYRKGNSDTQNLELLKKFLKRVNYGMDQMLEGTGIDFTLKRLRPTAATVANDATKDLNFVKQMLAHSNISQTDTYLKRTPSKKVLASQNVFEKALKDIAAPKKAAAKKKPRA